MIKGIGVEIVDLSFIQDMLEAQSEESLREIFTEAEIDLCCSSSNATERFATRFAAKVATIKALGLSRQKGGLNWTDIEVILDDNDRPLLSFNGEAQTKATKLGVQSTCISISHEKNVALAMVILEG